MKKKKLSNLELSSFCSQINMLLNCGMTIENGIDLMMVDNYDEDSLAILRIISHSLEKGETFSSGMIACDIFPQYMVDMIQVGEVSGNLDVVCESL
ncbi:MAG: type II secretion system F family protein, partial [Erysipelotrichaceae bacterium]